MTKVLLGLCGVVVVATSVFFAHWRSHVSPSAPTIAGCIQDLASCDYVVRDQAAATLRTFGPEAAFLLTRTLHQHESPLTRKLAGLSRRILPFLNLGSANSASLREKAAEQLSQIPDPDVLTVQSLILALTDENEDVAREVQRALRRIGPRTIPQLTEALCHRNVRIRTGAAQVLGDFGPTAIQATPQLIARLGDRKQIVRAEAAKALGKIGGLGAVNGLTLRLEDPSPAVRCAAADALGMVGANEAAAKLITRFSDCDTRVRIAAAKSVWLITRRADLSVATLVRALQDHEAGGQATFALGEIGKDAAAAIPALVTVLQEEQVHRPLRTPPSAALALGRIGTAAVPNLLPLLEDPSAHVRIGAAITLGFIGASATNSVANLLPLLKDKETEVRQAAAIALGSIQPRNPDIIPALKQLARDDDIFLASSASAMLREVDPSAATELGLE